jgi:hypothetical protein
MKNYACPKKIEARNQTIIAIYRSFFYQKLPPHKQYWTLCARHVDDRGELLNGSELSQLLQEKIITKKQFHGVDRDQDIIHINSKYINEANWYCGDLYSVLGNSSNFNPAIVNCDLIEGPKTGSYLAGQILHLLTRRNVRDVVFVINFVIGSRFYPEGISVDAIVEFLNKNTLFNIALADGDWRYLPEIYCYDGTGSKSKTRMGSIIFYR